MRTIGVRRTTGLEWLAKWLAMASPRLKHAGVHMLGEFRIAERPALHWQAGAMVKFVHEHRGTSVCVACML